MRGRVRPPRPTQKQVNYNREYRWRKFMILGISAFIAAIAVFVFAQIFSNIGRIHLRKERATFEREVIGWNQVDRLATKADITESVIDLKQAIGKNSIRSACGNHLCTVGEMAT